MVACIYLITNITSKKTYIGQTKRPIDVRFKQHIRDAKNGSPCVLHRAIRKYGKESFVYSILENVDINRLDDREIHWISELNPQYNMTSGGGGVRNLKITPEFRQRMSEARKGKTPWNKGVKCSEEQKLKQSQAMRGRRAWNKGIPNNQSAINGKAGALKMSNKATGRKKKLNPDGSWTWSYPKSDG